MPLTPNIATLENGTTNTPRHHKNSNSTKHQRSSRSLMFDPTVEVQRTATYIRVAALTLTLYEYCLTLSQERELIWRRRISVVSVLFLVNRYAIILQGIFNVIKASIWIYHHDKDLEEKTCVVVSWFAITAENLVYLPTSAFSAIRAYAIWDRDKRIFLVSLVLCLVYVGCTIYGIIEIPSTFPIHGCLFYATPSRTLAKVSITADILNRIANSCNIMFEIIVIALTWIKTIPTLRLSRGTNASFFPTLVYVMYRDGTLSFITIVILSVISLLSFIWLPFFLPTMLTTTLISIIVSRFIFHLREDYYSAQKTAESNALVPNRSTYFADMSYIRFNVPVSRGS